MIPAAPLRRALPLAALLLAPAAWGQSGGDTVVQAGWTRLAIADARTRRVHTQVHESARGLLLPAEFESPGLAVRPDSADTLGLAVRHFLTDTIAVELDLGLPPVLAAGAEWLPGGRWSLGATLGYARPTLRPSLAIVASDGTVLSRTQAELQVDSVVMALGLGYRFRLRD